MDGAAELIHGTAIALDGRAALIRGPSGSGKSDLALRCLCAAPNALVRWPAALVADDQTRLRRQGDEVLAECPATIRGLIEVRNIGLIEVPAVPSAKLTLLVDIAPGQALERHPDPEETAAILGLSFRVVRLNPFESSAPFKTLCALALAAPVKDQR